MFAWDPGELISRTCMKLFASVRFWVVERKCRERVASTRLRVFRNMNGPCLTFKRQAAPWTKFGVILLRHSWPTLRFNDE